MRDNSVGGGLDDQVLIAEPGRERDAFSDFLRSQPELHHESGAEHGSTLK
jgi:hypothetical protein